MIGFQMSVISNTCIFEHAHNEQDFMKLSNEYTCKIKLVIINPP